MQGIIRIFQETIGFFMALIKPSAKSIADNRGLFALSVVLAFTIWIFVTDSENPTETHDLGFAVPVEAVNVPDDVALADDIQAVRVRVTAPKDVFDNLSVSNFTATVDLTGYGVGENLDVPVDLKLEDAPSSVRIERITPEGVTVTLAQLTSKSVPVDIVVTGTLPSGYTMNNPEHEETVLVSGPQVEVEKVDKATATIDITGRTESVNQSIRLSPRESRGFFVQRVNLDPDTIDVSIDIQQIEFTRSIAVQVVTEGTVADGYNVAAISVDPPAVVVRGDESFISNVFAIDTQPIDIDNKNETIEQTVSLDLPSGATVPGGAPVVTVTIEIEPAQAEFNFTVPVEVRNLGDGLSIQGGLPTVKVILDGPLPLLREVEASDVRATVDLKDLGAGTYNLNVEVESPTGVLKSRTEPSSIQIILESS